METQVRDRQFPDKEVDSLLQKPAKAFESRPRGEYPSFAQLDRRCLKRIEQLAHSTSYPKGTFLFVEEQRSGGVFVVLEGRVKLSVSSSRGKSLALGFFGPGTVLGLESSVMDWPYITSAEVVQTTVAVGMSHLELFGHMKRNPMAGLEAAEMLSEACYFLLGKIKAIELSESAEEKLVRLLLGIQREGQVAKADAYLRLDLSQESIAQMIGVSRETVTRLLSRLKRRHILEWKRSTLIIQDRGGLEKLAEQFGPSTPVKRSLKTN